ncbi:tRNA (guanosine(37)-N1)-methyltransferase TrmD [Candidatus Gracilibacteria bacterium]|nr:tRNA (guanosine(37)-N1)-methyltransferase TrmD [Candidatus Gracilibacteria bacterium]
MKIHILTLFPESFESYFKSSIIKIAIDKGLFKPLFYNICDFSVKNTRRVDSRPYGGGAGTLISIEPLYKAISHIENMYGKLKKIYLTPGGKILNQAKLEKFAKSEKDIILICGHYEGIDERIKEIFEIEEISIGKYVLTSGELASMVFIDGIIRLLPGVINDKSLAEESYSPSLKGKKEYPQYTRPEEFMGHKVPRQLLSGDPKLIQKWKEKFYN